MATYRVETPDGSIYEVDGVESEQEAWRALQSQQGNPAQTQGQAPARAAPRGKTSIPQAAAAAFSNSLLVGAAPKIAARNEAIGGAIGRGDFQSAGAKALAYLTAPGRAIYQAVGRPDLAQDMSDDPQQQARTREFRGAFDQAARDRPVTSIAAGAAPFLMMAGAPKALDMGGRIVEGVKTGAMFGGVTGWNQAEDGDQRAAALNGATVGAAVGAAAPVVMKGAGMFGGAVRDAALKSDTVRGALNAIDNEIYMRPASGLMNQAGMSIGAPRIPPRTRGPRAVPRFLPPADYVQRRAAQFADRAGIDAPTLESRIVEAQADPRGRTMAELFGQPGVDAAATIARMPGQTGQLARTQLTERSRASGQRLMNDLTGEPGANAVEVFNDRARQAAAQYLRPALEQPLTPQLQQRGVEALQRLMNRRSVADAVEMARADIDELIQTGDLPPGALNDPGYLLHYAKMAIARSIKDPMALPSGKPKLDNMLLTRAARDISDTLEQIRPGYAQAMEQLQSVLRPRGVAEDIVRMRGKTPNVAGRLLGDPDVRRELGRPGLENFDRALRAEDELFTDAARMMPSTNSITSTALFGAMDDMATGGRQVPMSKEGMIGAALDYFRQGVNETRRNELGRFLLRVIDDPESGLSPQERQGIANELARIHRERLSQTVASRAGARAGAAQANQSQSR